MATETPVTGQSLRHSLSIRQMTMIAIGGVIGAGLFVGSGSAIRTAGPGVLIAYGVVGAVVVLVMRMLAELAVAAPDSGSFSTYAGREIGHWAGLAIGWLYAYHWCVIIGFEAIAGAAIAHRLVPGVPSWLAALVFMCVLTGVNLVSVRSFGRFEFWFALIKVCAIVVFIALGLVAILGLFPGRAAPGLDNLTGQGGFLPHGLSAVMAAMLAVFLSFFGTEVITVAAGEAQRPAEAVRRSMRSVVWRILVFYIGSIFVVVTLLPWNSTEVTASPYTAVLKNLGIPGAGTVMDLIVLTAVLSCLNSGVYASSRMLYSMASRGEAPAIFARLNARTVPAAGVLISSAVGFVTVAANYFLPTEVIFQFLLNSSGAVAVVVYLCITVTQIRGRLRLRRTGAEDTLSVRMWGFPYLSGLVLVVLAAVILGMGNDTGKRESLVLTLIVTAIAVVAGLVLQRRKEIR
ncbi:amino acid permease [Actinocrispum wychmicini]|uniref:GABA permease n=1 Tax=Actinocrispum wychmicini TaxID=1213861 RepID=A0A4V2S661_9PSEU|nr:amino acid permease [Actinocrispum wychmicini]TCO54840.1 GABA permease [Actinocrispum wychmicini]